MVFKIKSHVHLSDVGQNSKIRLGNLIDKFQNVGWMQFQDLQAHLPSIASDLRFFVASQTVRINEVPALNDPVTIRSLITAANRFKLTRLIEIRNEAHNLIASQVEAAFVVSNLSGRIAKLPADYPINLMKDRGKPLSFHREKIDVPAGGSQTVTKFWVLPRDIDIYGHMNNARYLDLVSDPLDRIKQVSINYLHPVKLGMELKCVRTQVDRYVFYTVQNGERIMSKIKLILKP